MEWFFGPGSGTKKEHRIADSDNSPSSDRSWNQPGRDRRFTMIHAAVIQAAPVVFDVERTLTKLTDLTADAARRGAQLAVFPEAFVSAYPKGLDFGARVGMRSPEGREQFRRYF